MAEDKKSLIDLVPDSIDNAVKNITDKPTQNIGTTLADIWYLVFGGISQIAEKRKLKYFYALQEFERELEEKISKIPEDKLVEPDIQIITPALDSARHCIEKEELRVLFSNLICSSMNTDTSKQVLPIFADIIKRLSVNDAKLLTKLFKYNAANKTRHSKLESLLSYSDMILLLSALENLGLIYTDIKDNLFNDLFKIMSRFYTIPNKSLIRVSANDSTKTVNIRFTELGLVFCNICISE